MRQDAGKGNNTGFQGFKGQKRGSFSGITQFPRRTTPIYTPVFLDNWSLLEGDVAYSIL